MTNPYEPGHAVPLQSAGRGALLPLIVATLLSLAVYLPVLWLYAVALPPTTPVEREAVAVDTFLMQALSVLLIVGLGSSWAMWWHRRPRNND